MCVVCGDGRVEEEEEEEEGVDEMQVLQAKRGDRKFVSKGNAHRFSLAHLKFLPFASITYRLATRH